MNLIGNIKELICPLCWNIAYWNGKGELCCYGKECANYV